MNCHTHRAAHAGVVALLLILAAGLTLAPVATGTEPVEQLQLVSRLGGQVNLTEAGKGAPLEDVCTIESEDTCQPATNGTAAGSFSFPRGIAISQGLEADVYVSDSTDDRVEKFNAAGEFVLMFGTEVNATKDAENGATEAEKDVCTAESLDVCTTGVMGEKGGEFDYPTGVAVEQATGDLYVVDQNNHRVEKFGSQGQFIVAFGGEVNAQTKGGVCQAGETCKAGVPGSGQGAFEPSFAANIIAVGGARGLVYVGDKERVEAFEPSGAWKADIPLASLGAGQVSALAIDPSGDLYVKDTAATGVRELLAEGTEGTVFTEAAGQFDAGSSAAEAVAVTPAGDVIVVDGSGGAFQGTVYDPSGAVVVGSFGAGVLSQTTGVAYDDGDSTLYSVGFAPSEVQVFKGPAAFAEAFTAGATNVQATGATVIGVVGPNGLSLGETTWFVQYGTTTALGEKTGETVLGSQGEEELGEGLWVVTKSLADLRPHEIYYYRVLARNKNGISAGGKEEFTTLAVPPQLEAGAQPAASLTFATATLRGSVNPENLSTRYHFEYGPCLPLAECANDPYPSRTSTLVSGETFGEAPFFQAIAELEPERTYHFRLVADNAQEVRQEAGKPVIERLRVTRFHVTRLRLASRLRLRSIRWRMIRRTRLARDYDVLAGELARFRCRRNRQAYPGSATPTANGRSARRQCAASAEPSARRAARAQPSPPVPSAAIHATRSAVVADVRRVVDNDGLVVDVRDVRGIADVVHGAVVVHVAVVPVPALVPFTAIPVPVVHAAVVPDVLAPVPAIPYVHAVVIPPIPGRPQIARLRRRHPRPRHPVVANVVGVRPEPRRPDVPVFGHRGLLVHRERQAARTRRTPTPARMTPQATPPPSEPQRPAEHRALRRANEHRA